MKKNSVYVRLDFKDSRVGKSDENFTIETKINPINEHVMGQEKRIEEGKG